MTATLRSPSDGAAAVVHEHNEGLHEADTEVGRAEERRTTEEPQAQQIDSRHEMARPMPAGPSLMGAFVDVLPVLPTIGAIATVFAYIGVGDPMGLTGTLHVWPLVTGAVAALGTGTALAICIRPYFTAPDQAHPQSFAEVRQRLDSLSSQIRVLHRRGCDTLTPSQQLALGDATAHQCALEQELSRGGPHWLVGTGYVDALTRLHRAEEALILLQPTEDAVTGALFDELRLDGSTIPERERLLGKLHAAIPALCPSAAAYLAQHQGALRAKPSGTGAPVTDAAHASGDPQPGDSALRAAHARMVLQGVRRSINEFRDESRARLIRSRARLFGTMTVTGLITYVLLAFAVSVSPNSRNFASDPIAAAAAIYLVGAVVGLFNRLYMESGDEAAGEDYGLSKTRLLLTPMLSGLAAVGGVMIVGMLSGVVDINAFTPMAAMTPTPTLAVGAEQIAATELPKDAAVKIAILSLSDIFNLERYPFALVLAAAFGLAPKSFLERLQRAGEQSKLDLKSTAASRQ